MRLGLCVAAALSGSLNLAGTVLADSPSPQPAAAPQTTKPELNKAPERSIAVVVELPFDRIRSVIELCKENGQVLNSVRASDTSTLVSCELPFEKLTALSTGVHDIVPEASVRLADEDDPHNTLEHCGHEHLEQVCEGGHCSCEAYQHQYHFLMVGALAELSGAIRGYNHVTVLPALQIGYRNLAVEAALGRSVVKIQSMPEVESRGTRLSWQGDLRAIFYGNGRNRAGFFIGGGFTHVPRDTIHAPDAPRVTLRDPRTEWWLRSPFGIEVRFAVMGAGLIDVGWCNSHLDALIVARAFVEPWFPIDRLENEVTVMFGLSVGVFLGDRNDDVPYAK